jgi:hypothetical protein
MILAPSSPDLSQEDEGTRAPSPAEECAPINPASDEHDHAEMPSFRPLSPPPTDATASERASLSKEQLDGCAIVTSNPRAIARSSIGAGAIAKLVDGTPGEGSLHRVPGLVGLRRQILLLCCVFLSGVAAGLGGARLAGSVIGFQNVRTTLSAVPKAVGPSRSMEAPFLAEDPALSGELAKGNERSAPTEPRESPLPPAALSGSPRANFSGLSSDANRALRSTDNPEVSSEVSALEEQLDRQFAEGRLDQPDNALDTYRKMAAIAPNDPATIALGGHLSAAVWSLADRARKDARLDDAVHYYGILKTLPPLPLAAILEQSVEPSVMERDAPTAAPLTETAPMASSAAPTPAVGAGSAAASSSPAGNRAPDQSASSETVISQDVTAAGPAAAPTPLIGATDAAASSAPVSNQSHTSSDATASREVANAGSVAAPTPVVGTNDAAASPDPVREQPPGHDTLNGAAASQDVADAAPIASWPRNAAAPDPEGPSAIIGIAMARGDEALAAGDVISARQFYELAASNGLAHAATAVGRTYDPNFLQGKGVRGALADAEAAKRWYQKAIDGGDAEAPTRLDKLLKVDQGKLAR